MSFKHVTYSNIHINRKLVNSTSIKFRMASIEPTPPKPATTTTNTTATTTSTMNTTTLTTVDNVTNKIETRRSPRVGNNLVFVICKEKVR